MAEYYSLKIAELKKETEKAVSIKFDVPKELKSKFNFIAGQYITLKTVINNENIRRAYSIYSSPNSNEISIAIKQVKGGDFSVFATTELTKDYLFEVSTPEGSFILETDKNNIKNYLAFASGSGITPILSMIKSVLETEKQSTFTLVFGNKSRKETLFYDEINKLIKQYKNQFFVQYVFSKEQPENSLFGRIDSSIVNYILKKVQFKFDEVFLCGPEQLIETVKDTLLAKDFNENQIHFELFKSKYKKENTMENLKLDGETEITILLDDETTSFTMKQSENILNAALDKDLDAPYSCQGGICSSCMAKVTEGKAIMKNNSILSDEEVAEGFVLTCEAHPTTDKIIIDYDV